MQEIKESNIPLIESIANRAATTAVHETFKILGVDLHDTKDLNELRNDLTHIRNFRKGSERIKGTIITTTVGTVITGFLYILWQALRQATH
jgi:hypothetical protein